MDVAIEIILTVAVIIGILLFVGVPLTSVLTLFVFVLSGLLILTMLLFVLFFVITDLMLLFHKRAIGKFVRFDDSGRFECAVYQVGDSEYICRFPAETVARRHIYQEKEHTILIPRNEKRKTAYDRHSLMIIVLGTLISAAMGVGCVFFVLWLIS